MSTRQASGAQAASQGSIDSDFAWLKRHLNFPVALAGRRWLAEKVIGNLRGRILEGALPYTLGVFGGWGTGKTTFLALLASELEQDASCKVIYFNSWKYAGFMEIVPALIYKILAYGAIGNEVDRDEAARRVLLALGKKYSDQVGEWAQKKIGVDPVQLFRDLYDLPNDIATSASQTGHDVIRAYYTQVDKAQDELRKALGTVSPGKAPRRTVIVLIDELDRCDPDEAFLVVKQMRVLFGMRDLPVAFVLCANPDPIGLAIKHRYGLDSKSGEFEARRILEKFVDSYEDLSAPEALGSLVAQMWKESDLPWIVRFDKANRKLDFADDVIANATAFDVMTTAIPLFSNIRVIQKSFQYVVENAKVNRHLLWTHWFLQVATQIDPDFRRALHTLGGTLQEIAGAAYEGLSKISFSVEQAANGPSIEFRTNKGKTLFSIYRSLFWECAKARLLDLEASHDPEDDLRAELLHKLLSEPLRVDFVVLLSLIQFENVPSFTNLVEGAAGQNLPKLGDALKDVKHEFGSLLVDEVT